jgi:hypothetical protein
VILRTGGITVVTLCLNISLGPFVSSAPGQEARPFDRIGAALDIAGPEVRDPELSGSAYRRVKFHRFVASVCVSEPLPRLGCRGHAERPFRRSGRVSRSTSKPNRLSALSNLVPELDGQWEGDGYFLRIDRERAQANIDADRGFAWQAFSIKGGLGDAILFIIGTELYEARVNGETLSLSSSSFRGEKLLRRRRLRAADRNGATQAPPLEHRRPGERQSLEEWPW